MLGRILPSLQDEVTFRRLAESAAGWFTMPQSTPPSILVADDDRPIRLMLVRFLTGEGYQVSTASNGEEALAVVEAEQPDLLLLDLTMPVMDGWEVYRRLSGEAQPVIIIITAGESLPHVAGEFPDAVVLPKPFDLDQLLTLVQHQLRAALPEEPHR